MDRMFPGVLEIPPGKRFAPICGDLTLFLQFCFCHICPSHHVAGQTVHVQNWKDEQGLSQRDIPKSQHRKPGAKTGGPRGDFYPADAGIVICDTDFRYGIPRSKYGGILPPAVFGKVDGKPLPALGADDGARSPAASLQPCLPKTFSVGLP